MYLLTLFKGILIGLSIAAPVGPIGLLCMKRTLTHGRMSGLVSGLGTATADALYGIVAAFGVTFISSLLINNQSILRSVGGVFLIYLGVKTFLSKLDMSIINDTHKGLLNDYISTLLLTITNPVTILFFAVVFASINSGKVEYTSSLILVIGVFIGSALWWVILSAVIDSIKKRLSTRLIHYINRGSGVIIIGFGVATLISLLF